MAYPDLFLRCLKVVLQNEGGFTNDPDNYGGATNKGITQRVYDEYRMEKELGTQSVELITDDEVDDIYYTKYWLSMNFVSISNTTLILQLFDMGVNSGPRTSVKILQKMLGVDTDGMIGPMTRNAILSYSGDITEGFKQSRRLFYTAIVKKDPTQKKFLADWLERVDNTKF
jgi:lysozyme family protein